MTQTIGNIANRSLSKVEMQDGAPKAFVWRGLRLPISKVLDDWEEEGCWWLEEEPRRVYRVQANNNAIYELHWLAVSGWELHRVYD